MRGHHISVERDPASREITLSMAGPGFMEGECEVLTAAEARQLAAALVALADEIEGEE